MLIDEEVVYARKDYIFKKSGNHTIFYSFKSDYHSFGSELFKGINHLKMVYFNNIYYNFTYRKYFKENWYYLTEIDFSGMFINCTELIYADLYNININLNSSINTSITNMFYGCISLKSVVFNILF